MRLRLALLALLPAALGFLAASRQPRAPALVVRFAAEGAPAKAKRPSREKRLQLAVEALERGERDDAAAVSEKVEKLRAKSPTGALKRRLDGLAKRLDALGGTAAVAAPQAPAEAVAPAATKAAAAKAPSKAKKQPQKKSPPKAHNATAAKAKAKARKAPPKKAPAKHAPPPRKPIAAGDVVSGTCVSVRDYGAFIEVDGARGRQALLHISEISAGRVSDVAEAVPVGSRVEAAVISVDAAKGDRVSLSLKRLKAKAPAAVSTAPGLEALAADLDLDAIAGLMSGRRTRKKKKRKEKVQETAEEDAPSALSLASAFLPEKEARQREQEFELLMRDAIYESGSSLTDARSIFNVRKKKGRDIYAAPFWTKIFPGKAPPSKPEE